MWVLPSLDVALDLAPNTRDDVLDAKCGSASDAAERQHIQLVVSSVANDRARSDVAAGKPIVFLRVSRYRGKLGGWSLPQGLLPD